MLLFGIAAQAQNYCQAGFVYTQDPNGTITLYDSSYYQGQLVSSTWQLLNGTTLTGTMVTYTYTGTSPLYICHTINSSDSCSSTICDTLYFGNTGCQAYFSYSNYNLNCGPLCLEFSDYSSASDISSWSWSFGDSTTSTLQNPVHTFPGYGSYYVCLTIANNNGCTDTYCTWITIQDPQVNCQAYVSVDTMNLNCGPNCFQFYGNANYPANVVSWTWNFGDGTFDTIQNPVHTFSAAGTYQVCLTITTSDSCTSSSCTYVYVQGTTNPCNGLYVITNQYQDSMPNNTGIIVANVYGGTAPFTYLWSNGAIGNNIQALQSGIYCVTVIDASGCTASSCENVYTEEPVDSLYTTPWDTCITVTEYYVDSVNVLDSNNVQVTWVIIDNGGNSVTYVTTYPYNQNGVVVVYLTINCIGSKAVTILENKIQINGITGIKNENSENSSLSVYPNPVKENVNLSFINANSSVATVKIINAAGQLIAENNYNLTKGSNLININTAGFKAGVYFIQLISENGTVVTKRMVK
ncbi:MAG: hypothetical protein A2275_10190 [Bacteroidetes bacterium RIFOXYA12_FULL_35_11]|nr:MAG: hypothetical protein A2X01_14120 [Bacteroidetes bacterium GWF2_35_48]OFY76772.1 MAG: hypothetical protein A2275_10190 [Bacteroidetes bacterium RIFOXYA12_FULL_35_11]OFZ02274.1 MAG: hypothetical protein A2491_12595 [Bacteroidetes bacterium RIFOXYC12_FULL_35_7]